jgi:thiol-disulfide isomerase/thioredoxin
MSSRTLARSLAALGLAVALAAPGFAGDESPWLADFDAAAIVAAAQDKDLLVDFTGSDWCTWCKRLDAEVFRHDAFLREAQRRYVLVALDFPNGEDARKQVPNPERNQELAERFEIQRFPTVLLMTPEGEVYAQTGYEPGGPERYVEHVATLREEGRPAIERAKAIAARFDRAEGEARVAVVEEALASMRAFGPESAGTARLARVAQAAFALDPANERGLKLRAVEALIEAEEVDDQVLAAAREVAPMNEDGLWERALHATFRQVTSDELARRACASLEEFAAAARAVDEEIAFQLYLMAAYFSMNLGEREGAKAYARTAQSIGTEDERAQALLEQILGS